VNYGGLGLKPQLRKLLRDGSDEFRSTFVYPMLFDTGARRLVAAPQTELSAKFRRRRAQIRAR
jgi:hypothetical protein